MKWSLVIGARGARALLGLGLLVAVGGCNSSKSVEQHSAASGAAATGARPSLPAPPAPAAAGAAADAPAAGAAAAPAVPAKATSIRIGAWLTQAKEMSFDVKPERLLQQFIREFGDGTVIDKVMVAPIQDGPRTKPTFYLVGMGQLNGQFRAMALALEQSNDDGGLYLLPTATRHLAEGSNCVMCYFRFSRGKVTGAECSEESTGTVDRRCTFRTVPGNGFFSKK